MNKAYTPKERAYRAGNLAWLGMAGALFFLLLIVVCDGPAFLDFCLVASIISAFCAVLLGVYSLLLASSARAWWAILFSVLVLGAYGLFFYLMKDFCVIC